MAKPYLPNIKEITSLGINYKTGLPYKFATKTNNKQLQNSILQELRILDMQNATRRYIWGNCYPGIDGELIERILYYKGQLMIFYMKEVSKWFCLPFTLCGELDMYGRYQQVTPLTFNNGKAENVWIKGLTRKVLYDYIPFSEWDENMYDEYCVIITDYGKQVSENIIPRAILQQDLLVAMSECLPMARTSMIANSGVKAFRVPDENAKFEVEALNNGIVQSALSGEPFMAATGTLDFQDITSGGSALKSEEFMLYMQSLDNYRLSIYGLRNGGLFTKKAHMLESEQAVNDGNTSLALDDGLAIRQKACDLLNSLFGGLMWVEVNEVITGIDINYSGDLGGNLDEQGGANNETDRQLQE